jgi:RHS repeat-associated protein
MTDNDGAHDYTYDPLYQIIQATHPTPPRPLEQFQYDQVGNWLGDGRVHNELNQLTEDDSCWYSYDADGNMAEKISKTTGDTIYFVWDIENKLVEVRKPGMVAKYIYDPLGRRVQKTVNGVAKEMRYDGQDLIMEVDENDVITASYTFGPGMDNPLLMTRNGNSYYYVKDGLGSVIALTDNAGSVVHEYRYSVFGEIVEESGDSVENPFTYTAREYDKETGNYYYRARYYDPAIGRFISEDPIGFAHIIEVRKFGLFSHNAIQKLDPAQLVLLTKFYGNTNLYMYVGNSSLVFVDPLGLISWPGYVGTLSMGYGGGVVLGVFAGSNPVGWTFLTVGAGLVLWDVISGIEWGKQTGKDIGKSIEEHNKKQKEIIDDICK